MKPTIAIISTAVSLVALPLARVSSGEPQAPSQLDCRKMILEHAAALENLDFRTLARLGGEPMSEKEEAEIKAKVQASRADPGFKAAMDQMAAQAAILRLFPAVDGIPGWVTEVAVDYDYVRSSDLIEVRATFRLKEGRWVIGWLRPDIRNLDEETLAKYAGDLSPAPPAGQEALDAGSGLTALVDKLVSAIRKNDWDAAEATGVHPDSVGLHPQDPPEERKVALDRLAQLPTIGAVPAPAKWFHLRLEGTLDGKEAGADIQLHWSGRALKLGSVGFW